jgi:aryl-phospho-beta-D-glucosidase BglC (GH1 family)
MNRNGRAGAAALLLVAVLGCSSGGTGTDVADVPGDLAGDAVDAPDVPDAGLPRLRADGTRIVDAAGREVLLRGVNLGGWMFHETWITLVGQTSHGALYEAAIALGVGDEALAAMRAAGPENGGDSSGGAVCPATGDVWVAKVRPELESRIGAAKTKTLLDGLAANPPLCDDADLSLRKVLADRFGTDGRDQLLDAFQGAWITEADIAWIAAQGFNVVRVPIGYRSLVRGVDADAPEALDWNPLAMKRLTDLLDWCARNGVYAVVDIQEAPGGQNTYSGTAGLYANPHMQDLTVQMWEHLSDLMKDRNEVAAYSLLAEPYGAPDRDARDVMYDRLVKALRARGDTHLCVIHDGFMGMDTLPAPSKYGWSDVIYSTHLFEWTTTDLDGFKFLFEALYDSRFTEAQALQGVPYYIGSFSTFLDADWAYDAAGYEAWWLQQKGYSWSVWTYKRLDDPLSRTIFDIQTGWGVRGRLTSNLVRPDPYVDDFETLKARFEAYRDLIVEPNDKLLSKLKDPQPGPVGP